MTREGVCEWHQSNRFGFAYNRRCILDNLKGLLSGCFKSHKTGFSVFWWLTLPNSSAQDIHRATTHVPISHLAPPQLCPHIAY
jgi:hypothetical protein